MYIKNKMVFLIALAVSAVSTLIACLSLFHVIPFNDIVFYGFMIIGIAAAVVCGLVPIFLEWSKAIITKKSALGGGNLFTIWILFLIRFMVKGFAVVALIALVIYLPAVYAIVGFLKYGKDL